MSILSLVIKIAILTTLPPGSLELETNGLVFVMGRFSVFSAISLKAI